MDLFQIKNLKEDKHVKHIATLVLLFDNFLTSKIKMPIKG